MAFPDESLSEGETVKMHLHPHWITTFWPAVMAVVAIGGTAAAAVFWLSTMPVLFYVTAAVALVLFIWLVLAPYIVWRSTHYVLTDKQVLIRKGVFSREERGIPLGKVNDVRTNQSLFDRIMRSGTILIESAGEHGQSHLDNVPDAIKVGKTLKELVEQDVDRHQLDEVELRAALKDHREAGGAV